MEQGKVDMFIATNAKKFEGYQISQIADAMKTMEDSRFQMLSSLDLKDPTTMLIISLLAGGFGIDRFMLGQTGLGILKLITLGGCGIWTLIDLFTVQGRTKEYNFQLFQQTIL